MRAWDAADDYLLQHLAQADLPEGAAVAIVNDTFGGLTTVLRRGHQVVMSSDSWLAHEGTRANLRDNGGGQDQVQLLTSLQTPTAIDALLLKVPKSLALLEDQLHRLRPQLRDETLILGAGMTRDIHTSTLRLFERILGATTTSLARRKARLIHCEFDSALDPGTSPYPTTYDLDEPPLRLSNHANLFSQSRLDVGTRKLLAHIQTTHQANDVVDLACGNGVIGLVAACRQPAARLIFVDESFMAVESARLNWQQLGADRDAHFEVGDGLEALADASADLILCNPPFHESRAVGDATAWRMLTGALRVLRPEGQVLLVGNRHLAYHAKLRRLFGNCEVLESDPKYVVLRATNV